MKTKFAGRSTTLKAKDLVAKYPYISTMNVDHVIETRLLNQDFFEFSRTDRMAAGSVSSSASPKSTVKAAGEIAKLIVKLLLEKNDCVYIRKSSFESCYLALVPACLRYKPGSYRALYNTVKEVLPLSECTESHIGNVGFKEIDDINHWRDFIAHVQDEQNKLISSSEEPVYMSVNLSSSSTVERFEGINTGTKELDLESAALSGTSSSNFLSLLSPSLRTAPSKKVFVAPVPRFVSGDSFSGSGGRSTPFRSESSLTAGTFSSRSPLSRVDQDVIKPTVVFDQGGCFIHFGVPIQMIELNSCTCVHPFTDLELVVTYTPHCVKIVDTSELLCFNTVESVWGNIMTKFRGTQHPT